MKHEAEERREWWKVEDIGEIGDIGIGTYNRK